ncbi:pyridoxal-phosphate dependent enzyme, partial [Streptomyces sp. NPDC059556]|uniref:pyridoxal-phosphate dependent enzyme n=1 Tax=Streptomyces sp. NPDC059556 TaxID=3346863 RepID=UPI003674F8AC
MHTPLTYADIKTAADRIAGQVRPVTVAEAEPGAEAYTLHFALEHMQHTGSFKARGAQNFLLAHREDGTLPGAGVTKAPRGKAGLACAGGAQGPGVPATR